MGNSNLPIERKEGIFTKIKELIMRIFRKEDKSQVQIAYSENLDENTNIEKIEQVEEHQNTVEIEIESEKETFEESLKIKQDPEKEELLKVQNKIATSPLNIDSVQQAIKDLSAEQIINLKALYKEQIVQMEKELLLCKERILAKRNRLALNT